MKLCKNNDNNIVLAKGLCRKCYDHQPERRAKRNIYTKYLNSVGGKATRKRVTIGVSRADKTTYMRTWRALNPDKVIESNKKYYTLNREKNLARRKRYYLKNRESILIKQKEYRDTHHEEYRAQKNAYAMARYYRKKAGEVYDSKTKTWRVPTSNDTKILETVTTNNKRTQSTPVSP